MHWGGTGVRLLPKNGGLEPADTLDAIDDADGFVFSLENRALLDVQLEIRRKGMITASLRSVISDRFQCLTKRRAAAIRSRGGPLLIEGAREHARRHHRRSKSGALFVGPVDDLDRGEGLVARINQRPQRLERSEDAEHAVELSSGRLSVEMAADRNRWNIASLAAPACEHRSHRIDGDGAPERLRAGLEPVAHLAVTLGKGQATNSTFRCSADRRGLHERVPEPLAVDFQVLALVHLVVIVWSSRYGRSGWRVASRRRFAPTRKR